MTLRVLIADDHAPTREEVREALEASPGFTVAGVAADAAGAVAEAVRTAPDVCVLDVRMPGGGVAAAWEIAARVPAARIVMLTVSDDDRDLFPALRAGACGYLLKDMDLDRLPEALAGLAAGRAAMPAELVARVLASLRDRGSRRRELAPTGALARLTSREWEVVDLLHRGRTTAQVAARLHLTRATVRSHAATAARKLGASGRRELLAAFADARG